MQGQNGYGYGMSPYGYSAMMPYGFNAFPGAAQAPAYPGVMGGAYGGYPAAAAAVATASAPPGVGYSAGGRMGG